MAEALKNQQPNNIIAFPNHEMSQQAQNEETALREFLQPVQEKWTHLSQLAVILQTLKKERDIAARNDADVDISHFEQEIAQTQANYTEKLEQLKRETKMALQSAVITGLSPEMIGAALYHDIFPSLWPVAAADVAEFFLKGIAIGADKIIYMRADAARAQNDDFVDLYVQAFKHGQYDVMRQMRAHFLPFRGSAVDLEKYLAKTPAFSKGVIENGEDILLALAERAHACEDLLKFAVYFRSAPDMAVAIDMMHEKGIAPNWNAEFKNKMIKTLVDGDRAVLFATFMNHYPQQAVKLRLMLGLNGLKDSHYIEDALRASIAMKNENFERAAHLVSFSGYYTKLALRFLHVIPKNQARTIAKNIQDLQIRKLMRDRFPLQMAGFPLVDLPKNTTKNITALNIDFNAHYIKMRAQAQNLAQKAAQAVSEIDFNKLQTTSQKQAALAWTHAKAFGQNAKHTGQQWTYQAANMADKANRFCRAKIQQMRQKL